MLVGLLDVAGPGVDGAQEVTTAQAMARAEARATALLEGRATDEAGTHDQRSKARFQADQVYGAGGFTLEGALIVF